MFDRSRFGKILVPLLTPFDDATGDLDLERVRGLVTHLIDSGNADSLVLTGTTGEFHTMTYEERVSLLSVVHDEFGDRIAAVAGVGCASTRKTVALAKEAERIGYDTVMVVAPYYAKPNQRELYDHFRAVAEAVDLSVMLYNIPIFTGVNIAPETVARLSEISNIVAIKEEAELNPKQMTAFLNATPPDFLVYNGDDTMILEAYAQGGAERIGGIISGASHLVGNQLRDMIERFLDGRIAEAAALQQRFLPLFRIMGQNERVNPAALWKDALRLAGIDAGVPRLPLSTGTPDEVARIRELLSQLNLISTPTS